MAEKELAISYDPKADVLYCSFGPPQEAIGEETEDGVILRRHPETDALVGFTIVDFSRRFQEKPDAVIRLMNGANELQHA